MKTPLSLRKKLVTSALGAAVAAAAPAFIFIGAAAAHADVSGCADGHHVCGPQPRPGFKLNPQPLPPRVHALNPQPLPPG